MAGDKLKPYRKKRDFSVTPEPSGEENLYKNSIFVVQKHDASNLHYDFRLEVDGVLKSWAVPRGPSSNPAEKRLAIPTEDHPLGYASFEGVIPSGQYGAGSVIVWDIGTYRNITERGGSAVPISRALKEGHASFWLEGKKLRGGYALTRVANGKKERWILVKVRDKEADASRDLTKSQTMSALSGRTIEEIRGAKADHEGLA